MNQTVLPPVQQTQKALKHLLCFFLFLWVCKAESIVVLLRTLAGPEAAPRKGKSLPNLSHVPSNSIKLTKD